MFDSIKSIRNASQSEIDSVKPNIDDYLNSNASADNNSALDRLTNQRNKAAQPTKSETKPDKETPIN